MKFIAALESAPETGASFSEICRSAGVSRPTGYKWLARFREEGAAGLMRRKPIAYQHPNATPVLVADAIADVRRDHPTWGPKKVGAYLRRKCPELDLPACSTIGEILDRRGFIMPRKRRVYVPPSPAVLSTYSCPNAVWCVDHKGNFPLDNGDRCGPLTMIDGCSRFLLRCQAVSTRIEDNRPIIESAMREFGLPAAIRSDGGPPFATQGVAGRLNAMTIWWIKMGIEIHRSEPGKPQQNGRLERLHRTLEEAIRGGPYSLEVQQRRFDLFRREYNEQRPHESLDQEIPASKYQMSWRAYPEVIKSPEYPSGMKVRKVDSNGRVNWLGHSFQIGLPLAGEPIGFEEADNGVWNIFFGTYFLMAVDLTGGKVVVSYARATVSVPENITDV